MHDEKEERSLLGALHSATVLACDRESSVLTFCRCESFETFLRMLLSDIENFPLATRTPPGTRLFDAAINPLVIGLWTLKSLSNPSQTIILSVNVRIPSKRQQVMNQERETLQKPGCTIWITSDLGYAMAKFQSKFELNIGLKK